MNPPLLHNRMVDSLPDNLAHLKKRLHWTNGMIAYCEAKFERFPNDKHINWFEALEGWKDKANELQARIERAEEWIKNHTLQGKE